MQPFLLLFSALLLCAIGTAALADSPPSQTRLNELKQQISRLESTLNKDHKQRSDMDRSLQDIEVRIGQQSNDLAQLEQQLNEGKQHQQQLKQRQQRLILRKRSQVATLTRLIQDEYAHRKNTPLKLFLNGQEPGKFARQLQYQRYVEKARQQQIAALNQSLTELTQLSEKLIDNEKALQQQQQALTAKQHQLEEEKRQRNQLLATLDRDISQKEQQLDTLNANRQHLQKLLDGMRAAISDIPADSGNKPFERLKYNLPWPTSGQIEHRFGSPRSGTLRWDGVVIAAKSGQPVRSIAAGRVIFADWLTGYGLMVIVDQGHGYMTLYGYNENLTTRVGDWVSQGAIIAHAGNSGGQRKAGLYFGIRHNGQPVDPAGWCSSSRRF